MTLSDKRKELFETELLGKITSAGRIYRKIIAQDKEALNQESDLLNQYILGRFSWNVLIQRRKEIFGEDLI